MQKEKKKRGNRESMGNRKQHGEDERDLQENWKYQRNISRKDGHDKGHEQ